TAIGKEDIEMKAIPDMTILALYAPNVRVLSTTGVNFIYMRGLGSDLNQGFEQSVGIFIDNVYYGRGEYMNTALTDMERVEVLRGPQGTLFGKNTVAGAISMHTGDPEFDFSGRVSALLGPFRELKWQTMVTGPIIDDKLAFRIAMLDRTKENAKYNTARDEHGEGVEQRNVRGKLRFTPNDWLDITTSAEFIRNASTGSEAEITQAGPNYTTFFRIFDPEFSDDIEDDKNSFDAENFARRKVINTYAQAVAELDDYTLTSTTGWSKVWSHGSADVDFSPAPLWILHNWQNYRQLTSELRLVSPEFEDFSFVAGLFYYESQLSTRSIVPIVPFDDVIDAVYSAVAPDAAEALLDQVLGFNTDSLPETGQSAESQNGIFNQEITSYSAFGDINWNVYGNFTLNYGVRVAWEKKHAFRSLRLPPTGLVFGQVAGDAEEFDRNLEREEWDVSPKMSVKYDWTDDVMTYVTYAIGYKAGGFTAAALKPEDLEYDAENSSSWEVGMKSKWFSGLAFLNINLFRTDFKNLQISQFNGQEYVVKNAARAISQGIELESALVPHPHFLFTLNWGLIHARYENFKNGPCIAGEGQGCDLSGKPLANAPLYTVTFNSVYNRPLFNTGVNFLLSWETFLYGPTYTQTDLDPDNRTNASLGFAGRVGFVDPDGVWSLMLYANNPTNVREVAISADVPAFADAHFGAVLPKRSFQLEGRINF
ncbi:MAG: TonB-dependent receptor, partial [Alphaproteobacteria bacterium]